MIIFYNIITGFLFSIYTVRTLDVVRLLSVNDWFRPSGLVPLKRIKHYLLYDTYTTGRGAPLKRH